MSTSGSVARCNSALSWVEPAAFARLSEPDPAAGELLALQRALGTAAIYKGLSNLSCQGVQEGLGGVLQSEMPEAVGQQLVFPVERCCVQSRFALSKVVVFMSLAAGILFLKIQ